jgi:cytochrome c oxidase accessory protein FixG
MKGSSALTDHKIVQTLLGNARNEQMLHFDVPWSVSSWILGLTLSTYLMAGFAREQVCTYMCPYARFQSAMFDQETLIIAYNAVRGEPRGKHKAADSWEGRGHCIDCDFCVIVCPMGIDIREGLQMECIACGLCVDACNNVMEKVGLPKGLISYDTESKKPFTLRRPRTFWYAGIMVIVGCLMLYSLLTRSPLEMSVIHDRNPLFVVLSDGSVRNGYNISILNKHHEDRLYSLTVKGMENIKIHVQASSQISPENLPVAADSVGHFRVFLTRKKPVNKGHKIILNLLEKRSNTSTSKETLFVSEGQ